MATSIVHVCEVSMRWEQRACGASSCSSQSNLPAQVRWTTSLTLPFPHSHPHSHLPLLPYVVSVTKSKVEMIAIGASLGALLCGATLAVVIGLLVVFLRLRQRHCE